MMRSEKVNIFIGSGEQSLLERKVLIYSLRKHTQRDLDIYVFNGTHNAVEKNGETPTPAPLPLHLKYHNLTEFSLYRYLIPELCAFQGKAIYLDSDMICLSDIGKLFDAPLDGYDFLAKSEAYTQNGETMWGTSVMLIDCERCRFNLDETFKKIDKGFYTYSEFSQFGRKFLSHHPYNIGKLDPSWNVFDRAESSTKLIHYTNLFTQPWKYPNHPYGEIWFSYFHQALDSGWISENDINLAILRGYARPDLCKGNRPRLIGKFKSLFMKRKDKQ